MCVGTFFQSNRANFWTAEMLNELRYAAAERSIPVPAAVERGKSRAGAPEFPATMMTNVKQYSYSFGYGALFIPHRLPHGSAIPTSPPHRRPQEHFRGRPGSGITDWRYPVSAGKQ